MNTDMREEVQKIAQATFDHYINKSDYKLITPN
jgi:hypothetical protein